METVPRGTGVFVRALQFVRQRRGHDLRGVEIAPALGDRVERGHQRGNVGQRDELQTGLFEIGQPLEVVVKNIIQTKLTRPKVRPYQTENLYALLEKQRALEKEVSAIVKRTDKKDAGSRRKQA